jgi:transcriptional coactivator HFI1/ADA1
LCAEAKELPDVDRLLDTMTLAAVENELPGGVAPQAAALLLAALQVSRRRTLHQGAQR